MPILKVETLCIVVQSKRNEGPRDQVLELLQMGSCHHCYKIWATTCLLVGKLTNYKSESATPYAQ
jgi:hypothetical protein